MIRLDWLNRTLDSDRDGISTYGARPRSADCTTASARLRIEPRVFLSLAVSVAVSAVFLVFLAMVLRLGLGLRCHPVWIHDQNVLSKIFFRRRLLLAALVQSSIG